MKILDPTAPRPHAATGPVNAPARLPGLAGLTGAVLTNRWKSMDVIAHRLADRLPAQHGVKEVLVEPVPLNGGAPDAVLSLVVARAHFAVVGLAN
jgi:hypothetical protein